MPDESDTVTIERGLTVLARKFLESKIAFRLFMTIFMSMIAVQRTIPAHVNVTSNTEQQVSHEDFQHLEDEVASLRLILDDLKTKIAFMSGKMDMEQKQR